MSTIETTKAENMTTEEWLKLHPEIAASAPAWADRIEVKSDYGAVSVSYDRECGSVEIGIAGVWENGAVRIIDPAPAYLYFNADETGVTAADLREFAADFTAAADAMERR